jgi:hypothetical protein
MTTDLTLAPLLELKAQIPTIFHPCTNWTMISFCVDKVLERNTDFSSTLSNFSNLTCYRPHTKAKMSQFWEFLSFILDESSEVRLWAKMTQKTSKIWNFDLRLLLRSSTQASNL